MEVDGPLQSKFDATCGVLGHRRLSRPLYYLACKSAWLVRSLCRSVPVRVNATSQVELMPNPVSSTHHVGCSPSACSAKRGARVVPPSECVPFVCGRDAPWRLAPPRNP